MQHFTRTARDESSDRPTLVDVKRLADILLPKIVVESELTKGVAKADPVADDKQAEQPAEGGADEKPAEVAVEEAAKHEEEPAAAE